MATDRDPIHLDPDLTALTSGNSARIPVQRAGPEPVVEESADVLPRIWKIWSLVVGAGLMVWFFIAWLALDRHIFDAVGESLGTAFALLVIVSIVGSVRRNHD